MSGVLDRQEVISVLDLHLVGQQRLPDWDSYRERIADALMALVVYPGPVQVRCTDMEDYARIHNDGYATAVEQFGEMLADARSDLAAEASAGDLMGWLDDTVKAMEGADRRPAEPAPVVTDEAVEVAAKAVSLDWENYTASMRTALEAAAPLLGPRPLLDREAVKLRLQTAKGHRWIEDATVDAVMELARPVPTPDQIKRVLRAEGAYCSDCDFEEDWELCEGCRGVLGSYADAVLALLNGAES